MTRKLNLRLERVVAVLGAATGEATAHALDVWNRTRRQICGRTGHMTPYDVGWSEQDQDVCQT